MTPTKEKILNSLVPVMSSLQHVRINDEVITKVAKEFVSAEIPAWDNDQQFLGNPEQTAQYYFFLDSTNFCFWGPKGQTRWEYQINGEWVGGYYAYSRTIKDAFLEDPRFFDAGYLSAIPEADFRRIFFKGRNELLLVTERHSLIRENFRILEEKYDGSVLNLLTKANKDTDTLIELLLADFPSFRDQITLAGQETYFLKRAQIFPSDLYFSGLPELRLDNLQNLTVFADYKLPQILESLGVLTYSEELNADIMEERLIPAGSQKEIELRAASIVAIECIHTELVKLGSKLTAQELDWILWVQAKRTVFIKPHHKTLTTFY